MNTTPKTTPPFEHTQHLVLTYIKRLRSKAPFQTCTLGRVDVTTYKRTLEYQHQPLGIQHVQCSTAHFQRHSAVSEIPETTASFGAIRRPNTHNDVANVNARISTQHRGDESSRGQSGRRTSTQSHRPFAYTRTLAQDPCPICDTRTMPEQDVV